jgi:thiamine biosynthesis lipoprotein
MERIERLMTDWERPGWPASDVVRINKAAGKAAVKVSAETLAVIEKSLEMSKRSGGAFDITFAVMRGLWKFDEDLDPKLPAREELERRRKLIDYREVAVDPAARTVKLRRADMKLGLGGIAKGYAVDRCAAVLRASGFGDFMVQAGGDLYVSGSKGQASWMVGVRDPRGPPNAIIARMAIKDHAFSTAGDYERAFVLEGKRYHHIIDPKTGFPATASREVTIFAPTALLADALDDAVFILGPQKGLALVESYPDCAALIVDADNKVWTSKALEGKLQRTAAPSEGL